MPSGLRGGGIALNWEALPCRKSGTCPTPESWRCPRAGSCGPPACSDILPPRPPHAPGTWRPPCSTSSWSVSLPCSGARSAAGREMSGNSWQFWGRSEKVSRTAGQCHHFSTTYGHFFFSSLRNFLPRVLPTHSEYERKGQHLSVQLFSLHV